jgi:uncharacterized protein YbjT (DUF2867 family)/ligand-binding SRPBCC domain-containing protein
VSQLILLTGTTGYVGGRLLSCFREQGRRVRCLTRRPAALADQIDETTEVIAGDVLDAGSLAAAFEGVDTAYYLVHSMGAARDFEQQDRVAAVNFASAAAKAGVRRLVYLGGLGRADSGLSKHLRSRQETGEALRAHHPEVIEFRASIVIGSGSLSFEMIRALVERLPIMICPRWVRVQAQPIAVEDLLQYLLAAVDLPVTGSHVYEIGGPDRASYGEIMQEYARQRGLRRWMIPVPLLTPSLSSLWLGLVTPLYARIGRKLVDSLRNPTVVSDRSAQLAFAIQPRPLREAIERALRNEDREFAQTRWSDALSSSGQPRSWGGQRFGSRLIDSRTATVPAPPEQAFAAIRRIGGQTGWYYANWLWSIRGFLDLLVGGVGIRRGRRDPEMLRVGDALDFWRVQTYEPERKLLLEAEMTLPGRAWLEFEVTPSQDGSIIRQTAIFDPRGLLGLAYWYGIYPLHQRVFAGMLRELARAATETPPRGDRASTGRSAVPGGLLTYVHESRIKASPAEVFAFHERPGALQRLIPPWEKVEVVESAGSLRVGSRVVLRGRIGCVPLRWVAVHTEYDPPHLFADRQESGPFAWWYHRHQFLSDGHGGTILRDEIEFAPPLGRLGRWLGNRLIRRKLDRMFAYRHDVTRRDLEAADNTLT